MPWNTSINLQQIDQIFNIVYISAAGLATMKTFQIKVIFSAYQEILVSEEFKNLMAELSRDKNVNFTLQSVLPGEVIILNLTSETGITPLQYYSNFTFTVKLVFDKTEGRIFTLGRIDQLIEIQKHSLV